MEGFARFMACQKATVAQLFVDWIFEAISVRKHHLSSDFSKMITAYVSDNDPSGTATDF